MHIFMILCDELRADSLGYMGNELVKTPHIDRLAEDSVTFKNSYCNAPMCVPSRVCIATGRHALSHGALDNKLTPFHDEQSFYSLLRDRGYKTLNQGKWHSNRDPDLFGISSSNQGEHKTTEPEKSVTCFGITDRELRQKTEYKRNYGEIPLIIHGTRPSHKDETLDSIVTKNYLDDLESIDPDGEPVFARLSIMDPHTPYLPSEPYASMYDPESLPLPISFSENLDSKPVLQRFFHKTRGFDLLTEDDYRKNRASYYGLVSHVDERVGTVISKLKEKGLYEDSLIIFTADHGTMLGEHGFVEKWGHMYEEVMRTPLLIKLPGNKNSGKSLDSFVESIDIMPTILDLCRMEVPDKVQGKSLLPYMNGALDNHKSEVYAEYYCGSMQNTPALMIRDKKWKLTSYTDGNSMEDMLFADHPLKMTGFFDKPEVLGELYDMENDPEERYNLFNEKKYESVKERYLEKLDNWVRELGEVAVTETNIGKNRIGLFTMIQGENMNSTRNLFLGEDTLNTLEKKSVQ